MTAQTLMELGAIAEYLWWIALTGAGGYLVVRLVQLARRSW